MNVYIIMFLIGLAIIGLGVYAKVHNYKLTHQGSQVQAEVVRSDRSVRAIAGQEISYYENIIRISTTRGDVYKTLNEEKPRKAGSYIRGYYIESTDQFMLKADVEVNNGKGPYILIGFGIVWCAVIFLAYWMGVSKTGSIVAGRILSYGIGIVFVSVGIFVGIWIPRKRKKQRSACYAVEGILVDYKVERDEDGADSYFPIYEYHLYGEPKRLYGGHGGSAKKYRQIGRRVRILINHATGDVYCEEDAKSAGMMGIVFLVIGVVLLAALFINDVRQLKNGGLEPMFRNEDAQGYHRGGGFE